jgi:hypothetical protein
MNHWHPAFDLYFEKKKKGKFNLGKIILPFTMNQKHALGV